MKHTDFTDQLNDVWRKEVDELIESVQAHGGIYEWDRDEDYVVVLAETEDWVGNIKIFKVKVQDNDILLFGIDTDGCEGEYNSDEIVVGHISYVTEHLPDTLNSNDKCEGITKICSHRIHWWYQISDVNPNFEELPESEVEHIQSLLLENFWCGELCCCNPETDQTFYGWWEIDKN